MAVGSKRRKLSNGEYESSSPIANPLENGTTVAESTKPDQRRSLFVRSLPASVTSERLTEHFSQSFPLKHATIVLDPATKISRGFGFVTFTDAEDTQAALVQFNNTVIDGRKIKVEIAEARNREIEEDITGVRKETKNLKAEALRAQRQKNIEETRPPKLIVRNLPWSVKTSEDLSKLFMSYGKVKHASVPKGKNGQLAGFGFVVLRGNKNAEKALAGVNGKEIDGRTLAVDWAVDKEAWEKMQTNGAGENDGNDATTQAGVKENGTNPDDTSSDGEDDEGVLLNGEEDSDLETDEEEAIMDVDADEVESIASDSSSTAAKPEQNNNTTVFIRNLPFTSDDESLKEHFHETFGPVRYARVVYDHETERSRGTGFVCFFNESDAKKCVKNAPKHEAPPPTTNNRDDKKRKGEMLTHSLLQNEADDPSGKYTMEGRILQVSRALRKEDADRRMQESSLKRDHDKRRLYLLSEGTIPKGSKLYELLGKAEIDIRESSARQRQRLIKTSPNLCLSLTRLSIRNLPRSVASKDLKALAREAVVGFSKDVKEGKRQPISKDESNRGGEADREAEKARKEKGKGIVKQVKIVFESEKTGSKIGEGKGGRSRGYGFIEYYGHRNALAGLRWLNGHLVKTRGNGDAKEQGERGKRLIVEFAIENAQVVQRRADREKKYKEGGFKKDDKEQGDRDSGVGAGGGAAGAKKRKRNDKEDAGQWNKSTKKQKKTTTTGGKTVATESKTQASEEDKNKVAMRNRVIAQKRQKRKNRKGGK